MRVAEAICKAEGVETLPALIEKYQITLGRIENYEICPTTSVALSAYREEQERRKEEREKAKTEFYRFVDREKRKRAKDGILKNKLVCFSHPLELELALSKNLVSSTFAEGGIFTSRAEECDYYICFEEESGARIKSVKKGRILTVDEFKTCLGL